MKLGVGNWGLLFILYVWMRYIIVSHDYYSPYIDVFIRFTYTHKELFVCSENILNFLGCIKVPNSSDEQNTLYGKDLESEKDWIKEVNNSCNQINSKQKRI